MPARDSFGPYRGTATPGCAFLVVGARQIVPFLVRGLCRNGGSNLQVRRAASAAEELVLRLRHTRAFRRGTPPRVRFLLILTNKLMTENCFIYLFTNKTQ